MRLPALVADNIASTMPELYRIAPPAESPLRNLRLEDITRTVLMVLQEKARQVTSIEERCVLFQAYKILTGGGSDHTCSVETENDYCNASQPHCDANTHEEISDMSIAVSTSDHEESQMDNSCQTDEVIVLSDAAVQTMITSISTATSTADLKKMISSESQTLLKSTRCIGTNTDEEIEELTTLSCDLPESTPGFSAKPEKPPGPPVTMKHEVFSLVTDSNSPKKESLHEGKVLNLAIKVEEHFQLSTDPRKSKPVLERKVGSQEPESHN
ncbi:unnamed protein product [Darwinula stevensoni]|uniref:Uncharacterized protein n=1 Tax=Darwinula stevensoni TaxID=69355 RepID=A0A7R8XB95_9CRUS|nr:unnamed protein product [Darwinula stevensoni]CAG0891032.1 unnamed protein product [Darwinula stevensoni]